LERSLAEEETKEEAIHKNSKRAVLKDSTTRPLERSLAEEEAKKEGAIHENSKRSMVKDSTTRPLERSLAEEEAKKEEAIHENSKRSLEEQSVFGNSGKVSDAQEWSFYDDDHCPEPLWACPVRGAHDADTFECVDLLSDLDSCGGCSAEDKACVSLCFYLLV
jgi:hypothetical protein